MMWNFFSNKHNKAKLAESSGRRRIGLKGGIALGLLSVGVVMGFWITNSNGKDAVIPSMEDQGSMTVVQTGNRLAGTASPYLREAALQPVHWRPWGEEAFHQAQREDKPILLDIGAVWCHWCHVMDVESYENQEIARLINKNFIAIKVDMDERPDIDRRYQQAVQALTGRGGWPLTAFLTPEGQVFFGGTYFPPEDRGGRVGLKGLLPQLAEVYKTRKDQVLASAEQLANGLKRVGAQSIRKGKISEILVQTIATNMAERFDPVNGGFGTGAKFPAGSAIELALARHFTTRNPRMLEVVITTLDAMAHGGVYDHIGGGFFRYSTDPQWRVPHFEKMNYDNAELLTNYLHAYQATGKALYRETAEGIMGYLNSVLSDQENGGFYAHQDADMTREDDGDYYTWTVEEVRQALSKSEAEVILRYYAIYPLGEMRENPAKNVPFIATTPETLARELDIRPEQVRLLIEQGTAGLLQARMKRKAPLVDQTIYIDRNGMLISAYLAAFQALGDSQAKAFALKTLDLLLQKAYREGEGMYHAYFEGQARLPGLLNDQVKMARALLIAFEVTGEQRYIHVATDLMDYAIATFWDPQGGGFFDRSPKGEALAALERSFKDIDDNPSASPNGVAALVLDRLAYLTNNAGYEDKALKTLEAFAVSTQGNGHFVAAYALGVQYHLNQSAQAVIIGKKGDPKTHALWNAALMTYRPGKMVAVYDPTDLNLAGLPPAVAGAVKVFGVQGEPKAYVCAGVTCAPPTENPDEVATLVKTYGLKKPLPGRAGTKQGENS
ncbi:MAG: thioredoxin domain-containing protein [Nitrospirae bacterium]|nr:thioredoxin domain-containing protein [Nitrospirota bacterium]